MFTARLILLLGFVAVAYLSTQQLAEVVRRIAVSKATDEDFKILANADEDELPEPLKHIVKRIATGEHLCCRNIPIAMVRKARTVKRVTVVKDKVKTGTSHCGTLGIHTCDVYSYVYR